MIKKYINTGIAAVTFIPMVVDVTLPMMPKKPSSNGTLYPSSTKMWSVVIERRPMSRFTP